MNISDRNKQTNLLIDSKFHDVVDDKTLEELIYIHKEIYNFDVQEDSINREYTNYFLYTILNHEGRLFNKFTNKSQMYNFIRSDYLDEFYKKEFKRIFEIKSGIIDDLENDLDLSDFYCFLDSEDKFSDLNATDIERFLKVIKSYKLGVYEVYPIDLYTTFVYYIDKLNSKGSKDYINNYLDKFEKANRLLEYGGIRSNTVLYERNIVNFNELSNNHLSRIYLRLASLDMDKAVKFIDFVLSQKSLDAYSFIKKFRRFIIDDSSIEVKNIYRKLPRVSNGRIYAKDVLEQTDFFGEDNKDTLLIKLAFIEQIDIINLQYRNLLEHPNEYDYKEIDAIDIYEVSPEYLLSFFADIDVSKILKK